MTKRACPQSLRPRISRRAFLRTLSVTISSAFLAACGPPREHSRSAVRRAFGPDATPQTILPSPMPKETPTTALESGPLSLEQFLLLSAGLTGVTNLDPVLGRLYLQRLSATHDAELFERLYTEAGLPATDVPLEQAVPIQMGIPAEGAPRDLATAITKLWYTGIYTDDAGEDAVATYVDSLAWQTLTFTKPKTICGEPGFWSAAPEAALD